MRSLFLGTRDSLESSLSLSWLSLPSRVFIISGGLVPQNHHPPRTPLHHYSFLGFVFQSATATLLPWPLNWDLSLRVPHRAHAQALRFLPRLTLLIPATVWSRQGGFSLFLFIAGGEGGSLTEHKMLQRQRCPGQLLKFCSLAPLAMVRSTREKQ